MPAHHTPLAALALAAALAACAGPSGPDRDALAAQGNALAATLSAQAPASPGALRVRLAFGAEADLDLYVTDPAQETVYFANTPTRAGGRLERDLRCAAPAPRVETVAFAEPAPGVYRVGVDYPKSCTGSMDAVAFVVSFEAPGGAREERRRSIKPGEFLAIVLEAPVASAPAR